MRAGTHLNGAGVRRGKGHMTARAAQQQARRGTEAVITAPTRNRMGDENPHKGSNPFLSAILEVNTKPVRAGFVLSGIANSGRTSGRQFGSNYRL